MQKSNIVIVFKISITLFILWSLVVTTFLITSNEKYHSVEVPNKYRNIVVFDASKLVVESLSELMLNPIYQDVYGVLKAKINTKSSDRFGVNPMQPIVFVEDDKSKYLIFELINSADFKQFSKKNKLQSVVSENKGYLILSGDFKLPTSFKTIESATENTISYYSQQGKMHLSIQNSIIQVDGLFGIELNQNQKYIPKPKGLLVQFPISKDWFKAQNLDEQLSDVLEHVNFIAIDYQGGEFRKDGFNPLFNAVLKLDNQFNIQDLIQAFEKLPKSELFKLSDTNYRVHFGNQKYTLSKLNNSEWFLGLDSKSITENTENTILKIQGDLSKLTQVKGSFFVSAGLSFIPGFAQTKTLLNKVESTDIEIKPGQGAYQLKGKIRFKDKQNVGLELMRYLMELSK